MDCVKMDEDSSPNNSEIDGKRVWFEFLLDNNLLKNHLATDDPDPSALDLLEQFVDQAILSLGTEETPEQKWKTMSLNLMALKVAAHFNWDLTIFKKSLPLYMVHKVLKDFVEHVSPVNFSIQTASDTICGLPDPILFALTTYNRWSIQTYIESALPTKQPKNPAQQLPGNTFNVAGVNEMVLKTVQKYSTLKECVSFLEFVLNLDRDISVPGFEFFPDGRAATPGSESVVGILKEKVTKSELFCLVCFDLGLLYFHEKKHQEANKMFQRTHKLLLEVKDSKFCQSIDREALYGYLEACRSLVSPTEEQSVFMSDVPGSKLLMCQKQSYKGVRDILMEDNTNRRISCHQRELLLQEAYASGTLTTTELLQISLCNALRQVCQDRPVTLSIWAALQNIPAKHLSGSAEFLERLVLQVPQTDRFKVASFLWSLHADRTYARLISPRVMELLRKQCDQETVSIPEEGKEFRVQPYQPSQLPQHENVGVDLGQLTLGLILSHDSVELDELLSRLHKVAPSGRYASSYSKWSIDKSYSFIIDGLGNKKRQDLITLLLIKAQHCVELKNFSKAKRLLQAAHTMMKEYSSKLQRALVNEMLYVDLLHVQENGYNHLGQKMDETLKRIQSCSACVQNDREIRPRESILRLCALYIMNMQQWQLLRAMDDPALKICASLVGIVRSLQDISVCQEPARHLWESLTKIFMYTNSTKRDFLGVAIKRNVGESSGAQRMSIVNFILNLRSRILLAVIISCLTRMYNIVKDDPANCLSVEHTGIWPRQLTGTHDLSESAIYSALMKTLNHAMCVHPDQTFWLRTKADIELANNQPVAALRYYLLAVANTSQYFQQPIGKETLSEEVLKKMIKCCSGLKCYMQVAVLCQFLDTTDYTTAFKAVQEKMCYDGGDSLYKFFWDLTILEYLVYMHNKRGEEEKKRVALRALNQAELNTCNPTQILEAAAQRRKSNFLLALARQYI